MSPAGLASVASAPARRDRVVAPPAPQVLAHLGGDRVGAEPVEQVEPGACARPACRRRPGPAPGRTGADSVAHIAAAASKSPASCSRYGSATAAGSRVHGRSGPSRRRAGAATSRGRRAPTPGRPPWPLPAAARHSSSRGVGDAPQPRPLDQRRGRRQQPDRLAEPAGQLPSLVEVGVGVAAAAQRHQTRARGGATCARAERWGRRGRSSASATASAQSPRMSFIRPREPELPHPADRQVALDRERQREAEQLGGAAGAAAARRRGR